MHCRILLLFFLHPWPVISEHFSFRFNTRNEWCTVEQNQAQDAHWWEELPQFPCILWSADKNIHPSLFCTAQFPFFFLYCSLTAQALAFGIYNADIFKENMYVYSLQFLPCSHVIKAHQSHIYFVPISLCSSTGICLESSHSHFVECLCFSFALSLPEVSSVSGKLQSSLFAFKSWAESVRAWKIRSRRGRVTL